ncbi:MAG: VIT family protein [Nocardioidaceae bacterium]|nr:VIT family protein [Nocardioidaceae bacterium]MCL2614382.1 VIT family protein [Nocardioidaceae bacterium]
MTSPSAATDNTDGTDEIVHEHGDAEGLGNRLNWLRAGVLGANDGIVSVAGIVMGVAGATSDRSQILVAGIAALVAGALSMAAGEYVSVSSQRDAELALIEKESHDLKRMPEEELAHLTSILEGKGLSRDVAHAAAEELTDKDVLRAHAEFEFGIDLDDVTNPWGAALASMLSFFVGALLPALTILLPSPERFYVTAVTVALALGVTGWTSARLGGARPMRAVLRNVLGGLFAMGVTLLIGHLLGAQVG